MPFMTGRIVDVKGALEQQPYRADGTITFHTEDPLADWNCGTFTLTVTNGRGIVTREMSKTADVTMPIGTLALLVFGAMDVNDLVFNENFKVQIRDSMSCRNSSQLKKLDQRMVLNLLYGMLSLRGQHFL